jgi:hypothetical protein
MKFVIFLGHISPFRKFFIDMLKKWNNFKYFAKSENLFFENIYQSRFKTRKVLKIVKIEGPLCTVQYTCKIFQLHLHISHFKRQY